jgi:hypothetical protein
MRLAGLSLSVLIAGSLASEPAMGAPLTPRVNHETVRARHSGCVLPLSRFAVGGGSRDRMKVSNHVSIENAGQLSWNGQGIALETLRDYLRITTMMNPRPLFYIHADPDAPCGSVQQAVSVAVEAGACEPSICRFLWGPASPEELRPPAPPAPPPPPTQD